MAELIGLSLTVADLGSAALTVGSHGFEMSSGHALAFAPVCIQLVETTDGPYGLATWTFHGDRNERLALDPTAAPPTFLSSRPPAASLVAHPNGVTGVDHVVAMVPALDAVTAGLETWAGLSLRSRKEVRGVRAAFMRAGSTVIELLEMRSIDRPAIWGVALATDDLDKTVAIVREQGGRPSKPAPAVQGGLISTVAPADFLGVHLAFMEPPRSGRD
jgi:hypothetical protein